MTHLTIARVTEEQVADWMGSDNLDLGSLISLLTELANGDYSAEAFKSDVLDFASSHKADG